MVILVHQQNEVEVRLKKYPLDQDAYFEEYVKVGKRLPRDGPQMQLVIAEEGVSFAIEITLKKGFQFESFHRVRVGIIHLGTMISIKDLPKPKEFGINHRLKKDVSFYLGAGDPLVGGEMLKDAKFTFEGLTVGKDITKAMRVTEKLQIDPQDLGSFRIEIWRIRYRVRKTTVVEQRLQHEQWEKEFLEHETGCFDKEMIQKKVKPVQKIHTDIYQGLHYTVALSEPPRITTVDPETYQKDGIRLRLGYKEDSTEATEEGLPLNSATNAGPPEFIIRTHAVTCKEEEDKMTATFNYRPGEFVRVPGMVKYPPPLETYAWEDLTEIEQKAVVKELQKFQRVKFREAEMSRNELAGSKKAVIRRRTKKDPPEWRHWDKMYADEREDAYKILKAYKQKVEDGSIDEKGNSAQDVLQRRSRPKTKAKTKAPSGDEVPAGPSAIAPDTVVPSSAVAAKHYTESNIKVDDKNADKITTKQGTKVNLKVQNTVIVIDLDDDLAQSTAQAKHANDPAYSKAIPPASKAEERNSAPQQRHNLEKHPAAKRPKLECTSDIIWIKEEDEEEEEVEAESVASTANRHGDGAHLARTTNPSTAASMITNRQSEKNEHKAPGMYMYNNNTTNADHQDLTILYLAKQAARARKELEEAEAIADLRRRSAALEAQLEAATAAAAAAARAGRKRSRE